MTLLYAQTRRRRRQTRRNATNTVLMMSLLAVVPLVRSRDVLSASSLPRPENSPMARLLEHGSDADYVVQLGLDRGAFQRLLGAMRPALREPHSVSKCARDQRVTKVVFGTADRAV